MNLGNMREKMMESVDYDDQKHPNDTKRYLRSGRSKAGHEVSESKGHKEKSNYGSRQGGDNERYSDRGMVDPDMRKLDSQSLPNTRKYSYLE